MTTEQKIASLRIYGFTVGERDPRINTRFAGAFMVVEPYDDDQLPTEDGRNGPWAVVGDDLGQLVDQAHEFLEGMF